jgi:hypothetical protein
MAKEPSLDDRARLMQTLQSLADGDVPAPETPEPDAPTEDPGNPFADHVMWIAQHHGTWWNKWQGKAAELDAASVTEEYGWLHGLHLVLGEVLFGKKEASRAEVAEVLEDLIGHSFIALYLAVTDAE